MSLKCAISWSAGKDSCLALLHAREAGMQVDTFVTFCEEDGLSKSHALSPDVVAAQVERLGGHWQSVRIATGRYGEVFASTLAALRERGHQAVVFGDIDLKAHRDWLEPACERAGLRALFPLWGRSRRELAEEILGRGIRARIVSVDTARLPAHFCGREYDRGFLQALPAEVCPCGEDGEFHSFVFDCPGMREPVPLEIGRCRLEQSRPPLSPTELAFQQLELRTVPPAEKLRTSTRDGG